jgi:hypothetical protein
VSLPSWLDHSLERARGAAQTDEARAGVAGLRELGQELGRLGFERLKGTLRSLSAGKPLEEVWGSMEGLSLEEVRRVRAIERVVTVDERAQRDRDAEAFRAKALEVGLKALKLGAPLLLAAL